MVTNIVVKVFYIADRWLKIEENDADSSDCSILIV